MNRIRNPNHIQERITENCLCNSAINEEKEERNEKDSAFYMYSI